MCVCVCGGGGGGGQLYSTKSRPLNYFLGDRLTTEVSGTSIHII